VCVCVCVRVRVCVGCTLMSRRVLKVCEPDMSPFSIIESRGDILPQGRDRWLCPPSTQLYVFRRPEDDDGTQFYNSSDDEDSIFRNMEESLQQKMDGQVLTHDNRLPTSKMLSAAVHLPGQANFNSLVCSAAFSQETRSISRSGPEADSDNSKSNQRSKWSLAFNLLKLFTCSSFAARRDWTGRFS